MTSSTDPWRLQFVACLQQGLEKLCCDALHHSRRVGVTLPSGFEDSMSSAKHWLSEYEKAIERHIESVQRMAEEEMLRKPGSGGNDEK